MPKEKEDEARELLELDVKEVSMVDRPANLREFLVLKRLEDDMGAFEADNAGGVHPSQIGFTPTDDGTVVDVMKSAASLVADLTEVTEFISKAENVEKELPADLKSAIQRVVQFLGKVAGGKYPYPKPTGKADVEKAASEILGDFSEIDVEKALPADLKSAIQRVIQFLGKVAAGKYPMPGKSEKDVAKAKAKEDEEEDMKKRHGIEAELLKAGKLKETEEEMKARHKKELEAAKAKKKPEGEGDDYPSPKAAVQKNAEDQPAVQIFDDGRVVVAGQPVTKARSFTTARTTMIKEVLGQLAKLLGDVDSEALKSVISGINEPPTPPANPPVEQGVQAAAVQKSEDGEVLTELKKLNERVEKIEKARSPSTSVEGDGGTDTTVKKNDSFWKGVL